LASTVLAFALLAGSGCDGDASGGDAAADAGTQPAGTTDAKPSQDTATAGGSTDTFKPPATTAPNAESAALWTAIQDYHSWSTFTGTLKATLSAAHEDMWVVTYRNEIVAKAQQDKTLPLPEGAILVKDNLAGATDTTPQTIAVMHKKGGQWYWVEYTPDGHVTLASDGKTALRGYSTDPAVKPCAGCHSGKLENDYIFVYEFK